MELIICYRTIHLAVIYTRTRAKDSQNFDSLKYFGLGQRLIESFLFLKYKLLIVRNTYLTVNTINYTSDRSTKLNPKLK